MLRPHFLLPLVLLLCQTAALSYECTSEEICQNHGYEDPDDCARCICPPYYQGSTCEHAVNAINLFTGETESEQLKYESKNASVSETEISFEDYDKEIHVIRAPEGRRIRVTFNEIKPDKFIDCPSVCSKQAVEIVVDDFSRVGERYCCSDLSGYSFLSESNVVGYQVFNEPGYNWTSLVTFSLEPLEETTTIFGPKCPEVCQNHGYVNPDDCTRCVCPPYFHGRACEQEMNIVYLVPGDREREQLNYESMNGSISETEIFFEQYDKEIHVIQAPEGRKIRITLDQIEPDLYIDCPSVCYKQAVEIVIGDFSRVGQRFCCSDQTGHSFLSESNVIGYQVFNENGYNWTSLVSFSLEPIEETTFTPIHVENPSTTMSPSEETPSLASTISAQEQSSPSSNVHPVTATDEQNWELPTNESITRTRLEEKIN